jgi:antitoxin SocA-like protein
MAVDFPFDFEKSLEALVYLAARNIDAFDEYKACKLIFLADKLHLVQHGRPITGDQHFALPLGPAPTKIRNLIAALVYGDAETVKRVDPGQLATLASVLKVDRSFQHPRLSAPQPFERECLSKSDVAALEETIERHGAKTFAELRAMTHEMVAYQNARKRKGLKGSSPMSFEDFFEEDSDALSGARALMIEDHQLRQAFPGK